VRICEQNSWQIAAIVKVIPLAIIRSPAGKEKINFAAGGKSPWINEIWHVPKTSGLDGHHCKTPGTPK
jgi:hypothetical protein